MIGSTLSALRHDDELHEKYMKSFRDLKVCHYVSKQFVRYSTFHMFACVLSGTPPHIHMCIVGYTSHVCMCIVRYIPHVCMCIVKYTSHVCMCVVRYRFTYILLSIILCACTNKYIRRMYTTFCIISSLPICDLHLFVD